MDKDYRRARANDQFAAGNLTSRSLQTRQNRRVPGLIVGLAAAVLVSLAGFGSAEAQLPSTLLVSVTANPNPAASGGQVVYTAVVKNDGTVKALDTVVTIAIPASTQFVKCTASSNIGSTDPPTAVLCGAVANGILTVEIGKLRAHLEARVNLTLLMPTVNSPTDIVVEAEADSSTATDDRNHVTSTVLPPGSFITFLPSGRVAEIDCGAILDADAFGSDTTAQLSGDLGCTSADPFGLKVTVADKVLDLNSFRIFAAPPQVAGNVGILVNGAPRLKIRGGSKGGASGIEQFDWCVKDEGGSKKLTIDTLRCFRARSAGFDTMSKGVKILNTLVDRAVGTANTTAEPPGGIGIHTRGDNTTIRDTIVRNTRGISIWLAGVDKNADGRVAQILGSLNTMRIENAAGVGLLLSEGPHNVAGEMLIDGDLDLKTPTSTDGVVVDATGVNNIVKNVQVVQFGGNGFVVDGAGTVLETDRAENVGLDGYVITGAGTSLNGNEAHKLGRGYVVSGADAILENNLAEAVDGDGFVVEGDNASLANNLAKSSETGSGYVLAGVGGVIDTNEAENNCDLPADLTPGEPNCIDQAGFLISGQGYTVNGNKSTKTGGGAKVINSVPVNNGMGFWAPGTGNTFTNNRAESNDGFEWVIGPGNIDGGSNKTNTGPFTFPLAGGSTLN